MLNYDLTQRGNTPLYRFLYSCIRKDIETGALAADTRLPSKRRLAEDLNLSVNTVMTAYDLLVSEGFVYTREKKGYYVSRLNYRAPKKKARPPKAAEPEERAWFMDFRAGHAPLDLFPTSLWAKCMREAISAADSLYTTVSWKGLAALRNAIAADLADHRGMTGVSPEQIVIGAGTEYLYGRLMEILGPGITIAGADTGPSKFAQIAANHGSRWCYVPVDEKNMRADCLAQTPASVVHLSPANLFPYGRSMPIDRRIAFFEWANAAPSRWIIEDNYDAEFCFGPAGHRSMFSEDAHEKVIYLNTLSKTMVPTLRISFMVLPEALLRRYEETVSFYTCTVSSFEQYALALFIERGYYERHLFRLLHHYRKLRAAILDEIQHNPILSRIAEVADTDAGTHFLMTVHTDLSEAEILSRAEARSLRFHFFHPKYQKPRPGEVQLIINFAAIDESRIPEVFARLGAVFEG
jgi:GntR family transcriptional regulator/MocR family aminotransferase